MVDPLAEVVGLLQPSAPMAKTVSAAGSWRVQRSETGKPFYNVVLQGSCLLAANGMAPVRLDAGDFVLIPAAYDFTVSSHDMDGTDGYDPLHVTMVEGGVRLGDPDAEPDVRMLVGHFTFGSPDAALLVSLLPALIHVGGEQRLSTIVQLLVEETRAKRPAREVILARLLEVLLIEALRSTAGTGASPGLLRGLSDGRLAAAIRRMHEEPTRAWTVLELAREASLSRSAFFDRFSRAMGVAPMEYLLSWRMALAKNLLRRRQAGIAEIAERVGYSSASTFSVAFTRFVGLPPTHYARTAGEAA
ncbi:AraC family transcriptional regulator [Pararhizobium sp. O133]|uniref:AraC family transcriptional regulator n=1 Tax=Pararhizobium sp. O133 TaxID=3449278 RepID=UPI003F6893F3